MRRRDLRGTSARRFRPVVEAVERRELLTTFTVTNTNDDGGTGSLRWAINQSNATNGPNTINFNIGLSGVQTIAITSALPAVTAQVTIDGTTEPGYASTPLIELNGAGAGSNVDGLDIKAGFTTVKGLAIDRFSAEGISLSIAGHDVIQGDFIGTDPSGTIPRANGKDGVLIVTNCNGNTIQNDVISGNSTYGIYLRGDALGGNLATSSNLIAGNLIGTDVAGKFAIANSQTGIYVQNAPLTTVGGTTAAARNIISGNAKAMALKNNSDNCVFEGNYIGTDITGTQPLGNGNGIGLEGISNSTIGGTAAGAGNVISENKNHGIDSFVIGSGNLAIEGNLIGTDYTGTRALGNTNSGIYIGGESNVTIGGTVAGARNVLSGNGDDGVTTFGSGPGLLIQGNYIGTDITGTRPLGNGGDGIHATFDAITIGGLAPGAGNIIANNGFGNPFDHSGVVISGKYTPVLSNSIYNNEKLGIELSGGNQGLAAPVLSSASSMTFNSTINGSLTAAAGIYTLQFFATPSPNVSGNGEGATLIGTSTLTVSGTSANFTLTFSTGFGAGTLITATATDQFGNTSAFSTAINGSGTGNGNRPPTVTVQASALSVPAGQSVADTFTISNPDVLSDSGVVFSDTIPANASFVAGTTSTGVPVVFAGGVATAAIGSLVAGQPVTVTIVLATSALSLPSFTNVGGVSSTSPAFPAGSDVASVTTAVTLSSDLSVSIADLAPPTIGGGLDYQVLVTNKGPVDDTGVVLQDTLPAGVPYAGASTPQGTVYQSGGVVTASLGTLAAGSTVVVTIHLRPVTTGPVVDSAAVGGVLPDPNLANNQATFTDTVLPTSDLSVSIADLAPPRNGGNLDYQVSVTNNGPAADTNVTLRDPLPAGTLYAGASTPQGTVSQSGGVVTASLGTLAVGATVIVTIHLKPTTAGPVVDSATVTGDLPDPVPANNLATFTDTVLPVANVAVVISTSAPRAIIGHDFTYTVVVTNPGPNAATGVTLTDVLPANASLGNYTLTQGAVTYSASSRHLVASIGTLGPNGSATLVIHVIAPAAGSLADSASVVADQINLTPGATSASIASAVVAPSIQGDFDGDGRADIAVYGKDPNDGNKYDFRVLTSSSGYKNTIPFDNHGYGFGNAQSIPVPADYFGDGRAAYALWYPNSLGGMTFTAVSSVTGQGLSFNFGGTHDLPVIADVDGDGKADFGVYGYDPTLGYRFDFLLSSANFSANQQDVFNNNGYGYGNAQSIPVVADFDGSGKAGFGLYVPSAGGSTFYYTSPSAGVSFSRNFGGLGDIPTAIDYDGDGKADLALYGPSSPGHYRYTVLTSVSGYDPRKVVSFDNGGFGYGGPTSVPVIADYDGTGRADFALYVPDSKGGMEYVYQASQTGGGVVLDFATATATDLPLTAPLYLIAKKVRGY